jgi:tetratricopeptide (TPR) repeat protein
VFSRVIAAVAFLICIDCSRAPRESLERLAILPIENLTSDTNLDWVSRAAAAILAYDLTGPQRIHPVRVESISDARLNTLGSILQGYFARERGVLTFHETLGTRSLVVSDGDNVVGSMNALAKELTKDARSFTCNAAALRPYGEALQAKPGAFEAAAQADPSCVPIYLPWAETLLAHNDREGAARVCDTALALPNVDAIDRAQFEFLAATAKGDTASRLQALQKLALLLPSDAELWRNTAVLQLQARDFQAAVKSFEAAVKADPGDAQNWNVLGYARAYAHDLNGAKAALDQYQKLLPSHDANGLDSLGEVSFYLGDFSAAESYFLQAHKRDPSALGGRELLKAAQARMMTGNLAEADRILAGQSNLSPLERAQWEFITGRRKQAVARLEALSSNPRAALQLALWNGTIPANANDAFTRAVSLCMSGRFAEATPILEQLYRAANPAADGQIRTLLAWSYAHTGRSADAAKLLDLYPIPLSIGDPMLSFLVFPRFVQLRGELLHSQRDAQLATTLGATK